MHLNNVPKRDVVQEMIDTARAGRRPVIYANAKVQKTTGLAFRPLAETLAWCAAELAGNLSPAAPVVVT